MKNRDWLKAWYTPILFALPTYVLLMFALQVAADVDLNRWFKLGLYFALYFFFVWFLAKIANIGTEVATSVTPPMTGRFQDRFATLENMYFSLLSIPL